MYNKNNDTFYKSLTEEIEKNLERLSHLEAERENLEKETGLLEQQRSFYSKTKNRDLSKLMLYSRFFGNPMLFFDYVESFLKKLRELAAEGKSGLAGKALLLSIAKGEERLQVVDLDSKKLSPYFDEVDKISDNCCYRFGLGFPKETPAGVFRLLEKEVYNLGLGFLEKKQCGDFPIYKLNKSFLVFLGGLGFPEHISFSTNNILLERNILKEEFVLISDAYFRFVTRYETYCDEPYYPMTFLNGSWFTEGEIRDILYKAKLAKDLF